MWIKIKGDRWFLEELSAGEKFDKLNGYCMREFDLDLDSLTDDNGNDLSFYIIKAFEDNQ